MTESSAVWRNRKSVPLDLLVGGKGTKSLQSAGPRRFFKLLKQDSLYGLSPWKSSSTLVRFLALMWRFHKNMMPVKTKNNSANNMPTAATKFGASFVAPRALMISKVLGRRRESKNVRQDKQDHQFSRRKYLWLRQPMQPPIHGQ